MRNFLKRLMDRRARNASPRSTHADANSAHAAGTGAASAGTTARGQRAPAGLRASDEEFTQLVAGVRDYAVFLLDPQGYVRTWNAGAQRIKGYRAEEIIGQHFSRFYPPDAVSSGWPDHELSVAAAKGRFEDEGWRVRRDGTTFWANVVITALRDEGESVRGFLKITRDLTDRKQAEEKLRLSEERFRLMVEGVNDYAIFMLDLDGNVATWNGGAQRLKGYRAEEIIGQHFSRFYPQDAIQRGWPDEELRTATAEGRLEDEGWRVRKDGSTFWASVVITALRDENGTLRGFVKITRDLTERRQAEENARKLLEEAAARKAAEDAAEEIERQREQLRVTLTSIGDAVIVTDTNGNITFLNPVAASLTGWKPEEAAGQPLERVFRIVNERTGQPVENPVTLVFRQKSVVALANHTALIAKDGRAIPIEDTAAPILRSDDGEITGVVLVFRDVTQARRAIEARLRLAAIVESSDDAIVGEDLNGCVNSWNRGAERLYGYTASEMMGQPLNVLLPPERAADFYTIKERVAQGENIEHYETQRICKDGRRVDVSLTISPIRDSENTIIGASRIARDITQRKQNEQTLRNQNERLRLLWQAAVVLLQADDPDTLLRNVFAKIGPHLGLDVYFNYMVDESGETLHLVSSAGIADDIRDQISHIPASQTICGTAIREQESVVVAAISESDAPNTQLARLLGLRCYVCNPLVVGGTLRGTLAFASRTKDELTPDELEFVQTLTRYITVAYERLRLIQQLQESDRRKDEFLATLAHELRNPLAPLRSGLQVMRLARDNAEVVEQTHSIMERQLEGMIRLVDDLLDVSRISRGKVELRTQRLPLDQVVQSALETCEPMIRQYGHKLSVRQTDEPLWVQADKTRLAQALSNLLRNAVQYTNEGGQIWLAVERRGDQATISVKDTGIGIPPEMLGKIFNMFTQVDRSMEQASGGLGIGLTLVKQLVELHGGTVEAFSHGYGKGSEFIIHLPIVQPEASEERALENNQQQRPGKRYQILVADDNADAVGTLAMMLELMGHEVRTAGDGQAAVELAEAFAPDLILMDIGMPNLNGYEAARRIRSQPRDKRAILVALTGWGQEEDRRRSKEAGFDFHIIKPVEPATLEKLLAELESP